MHHNSLPISRAGGRRRSTGKRCVDGVAGIVIACQRVLLCVSLVVSGVGAAAERLRYEELELPPGFSLAPVSEAVPNARQMAIGREGTIFVGTRQAGARDQQPGSHELLGRETRNELERAGSRTTDGLQELWSGIAGCHTMVTVFQRRTCAGRKTLED